MQTRAYVGAQRPRNSEVTDLEHITAVGLRNEYVGRLEVSTHKQKRWWKVVHETERLNFWGPVEHFAVMNVLQACRETTFALQCGSSDRVQT